ncbi:hypothetical protein BDN70DRAFT_648029 [Pholiota conissans]|uniref:Uncharacterized protein n=1 Tax=Pholiota conissans TaxID=109636 RepID=A0A9P5YJ58_9AGAR|nr:hypothetical protein BDN70DRAFT_648029 [Pholiota conissans]
MEAPVHFSRALLGLLRFLLLCAFVLWFFLGLGVVFGPPSSPPPPAPRSSPAAMCFTLIIRRHTPRLALAPPKMSSAITRRRQLPPTCIIPTNYPASPRLISSRYRPNRLFINQSRCLCLPWSLFFVLFVVSSYIQISISIVISSSSKKVSVHFSLPHSYFILFVSSSVIFHSPIWISSTRRIFFDFFFVLVLSGFSFFGSLDVFWAVLWTFTYIHTYDIGHPVLRGALAMHRARYAMTA